MIDEFGHDWVWDDDTYVYNCCLCDKEKYPDEHVLSDCPFDPLPLPGPGCMRCDRELCAELDAFYGHDPRGHRMCDKCRRKEMIE